MNRRHCVIAVIGIVYCFASYSPQVMACASCGFGEDGTRGAFILTTGIMTVIPLALLTGIAFYLKFLYQKQNGKRSGDNKNK